MRRRAERVHGRLVELGGAGADDEVVAVGHGFADDTVEPAHLALELWLEEPAERGGRISSSSPATMDDSRRCSRRREREWEGEASSEPPLPCSLHRAASARASAAPPREGAVGAGRVAEEQERE